MSSNASKSKDISVSLSGETMTVSIYNYEIRLKVIKDSIKFDSYRCVNFQTLKPKRDIQCIINIIDNNHKMLWNCYDFFKYDSLASLIVFDESVPEDGSFFVYYKDKTCKRHELMFRASVVGVAS